MIGGEEKVVERLRPIFETLAPAPDKGWGRVGAVGSGHYTKMIHNGIEYGLMQAYAEGFSILQHKSEFKLDLHQIAEIWRYGSVVRSWLLDLTADASEKNPDPARNRALRRRLRRGSLDRGRSRRTRACPRWSSPRRCSGDSVRAIRRLVLRQASGGDAQSVRRARDQKGIARAPATRASASRAGGINRRECSALWLLTAAPSFARSSLNTMVETIGQCAEHAQRQVDAVDHLRGAGAG